MKVLTLDLETQNHTLYKRKANPFDTRNYVVQVGWQYNDGECHEQYYPEYHVENVLPDLSGVDIIVGHNIKFDLLYVWHEDTLKEFFKRGGRIWDTQYAEYLLEGMVQESQMNSMNDIAVQYGGGLKIDAVKEMWQAGVLTADIDRQLLTDYLIGDGEEIVGDIKNTWLIFKGQVARVKERGAEFTTMIWHSMDSLLATTEMEYNGLYVDQEVGEAERISLINDIEEAQKHLNSFLPELPPELVFNWGSSQMKSCLIFGGTVKYDKRVLYKDDEGNLIYPKQKVAWPLFKGNPVDPAHEEMLYDEEQELHFVQQGEQKIYQDTNKGGKNKGLGKTKLTDVPDLSKEPKGSLQDHFCTFEGLVKPKAKWKGDSTDARDQPLYSTAAEVIDELSTMGIPFTDALGAWVGKTKDLSTFYWTEAANGKRKGMLTLVDPETGIVHQQLNHTSTVTRRLSSSNPNSQNIPREGTSNVKKMFRSRFPNGRLAEVDYSQLEVVVTGVITRDKQLRADLNNKVDFHCKRLSATLGEDYQYVYDKCHVEEDPKYKKLRQKAKIFSFQRAYGAGVAKIANSTGMTHDEVNELIAAEEKLYPGIGSFDNKLIASIEANQIFSGNHIYIDAMQFRQMESHWDSPTGTRYTWRQQRAPQFMIDKGQFVSFSPTERKNYPMQGFGGEIMQTMLGKVWRHFVANDMFNGEVLLTNTVHDCCILDGINEEVVSKVALDVQDILETVPEVFNSAFPKLKIDVPFPCETEIGSDLFTMKVIKRD